MRHDWLHGHGNDPVRDDWSAGPGVNFGIELEVSYIEDDPSTELGDWACERDGSLPKEGGEFVSPPVPARRARAEFARACEVLKDHGADVDSSCGAHIHITRKAFSEMGHALVRRFLYDHQDLTAHVFGRKPNTYARYGGDNNEKYSVQNLRHKNTVEYRLSAGTLDPDDISLRLDLLECLYSLVAHLKNVKVEPVWGGDGYSEPPNELGVNCSTPGGRTRGFCGITMDEFLTRAKRDFPCLYEQTEQFRLFDDPLPVEEAVPSFFHDPNQFVLSLEIPPCAASTTSSSTESREPSIT